MDRLILEKHTYPEKFRATSPRVSMEQNFSEDIYSRYIKWYSVFIVLSLALTFAQPQAVFANLQTAHVLKPNELPIYHPASELHSKESTTSSSNQTILSQTTSTQHRLSTIQADFTQRLDAIRPLIPNLKKLVGLTPLLPELIGMHGEKQYLILLQNNHELRATGGFITSVGRLTLKDGKIKQLFFADSHKIFNENSEYPWAPPAMQRYMGVDLMLLRDANWSPDLPTSAQLIRSIYLQDRNVAIDGIITLDLQAITRLINALGPLQVEGIPEPMTGENAVEQIKALWYRPLMADTADEVGFGIWWHQRKSFIPALVRVAQERLATGNVNYAKVVMAGLASLNSRSIQVWLANEQAAAQLAEFQWDGGLHPSPEIDFLAVVDSNLGYNKVDALLKREIAYSVTWPNGEAGPALATATINYVHPRTRAGHICDPTPRYGNTYDDMSQRCYFNYVRLFVPAGSNLIKVEGVEPDSISSRRGEKRTQVLAGYFRLEPGDKKSVTFQYELPPHITPDNYQLQIQRQSGTAPLQLNLDINRQQYTTTLYKGYLTWQEPRSGVTR